MVSVGLRETLPMVAAALAAAEEEWWIISSAAVALHGGHPIDVDDVDVLLGMTDARRIFAALGIAPADGTDDGLFRSILFGRWIAPPLTVEFMAGFHVRAAGRWITIRPRTREPIDVVGARLFVPSRAELRDLLLCFGRPKDRERARLLDDDAALSPR